MPQNIFHKVIKSENQISQLLVNLVNENKDIRTIITEFFFPTADGFTIDFFDTQKRDKYGQPDIQFDITNKNRKLIGRAIVEVKTQDSPLTDKQREGEYKQKLLQTAGEKKYLFFLIPKYYKHEQAIKDSFFDSLEKDSITCGIFYWDILVSILMSKKQALDSNLLTEIIGHLNDKFNFKNIEFNLNQQQIDFMFTKDIPMILYKLNDLVNSVADYLKVNNSDWHKGLDQGGGSYGQGYCFYYNSLCFGYDFDLWLKQDAVLVISVNISQGKAFTLFDDHFRGSVKSIDNENKYIDLSQKILKEDNVEYIIKIIQDFTSRLNSTH